MEGVHGERKCKKEGNRSTHVRVGGLGCARRREGVRVARVEEGKGIPSQRETSAKMRERNMHHRGGLCGGHALEGRHGVAITHPCQDAAILLVLARQPAGGHWQMCASAVGPITLLPQGWRLLMCFGTFPAFEGWWVQALLWLDVVSSSGTLPAVGQHSY